jgi:menaquinone-dependent protoporphyrinogen oxidase
MGAPQGHATLAGMTDRTLPAQSDHPASPAGPEGVLVAYATRYGSTRGIAERIAAAMRLGGHRVDLRPVEEVESFEDYEAVVFGSPVFDQAWPPEGQEFVRRNREALARVPLWLFTVGTFGDRKPLIGPLVKREPKGIRELLAVLRPHDYRVFAGAISRHQWPWFGRLLFHAFGGRLGDNRDWPEIDAWAAGIARALGSKRT